MRMLIVHVTPSAFGPEGLFGGGERYPVELARAMARRVPCRLVTFGTRPSRRSLDNLEIVTLRKQVELRGHPAHPLGTGLGRAMRDATVIHTHQMRSAPSRMSALLAKRMKRPVAVTDHGLGAGGWCGLLPRMFTAFLPVSQHSAEILRAPPARTRVIHGGVDVDRFAPGDGPRKGVLYVGRITPHKGIDTLIQALPPGQPLTIVGTGGHDPHPPTSGYPELLRRLAGGKDVRWLFAVPDADLPSLYQSAQAVVLPSVLVDCYGRRIAISELSGLVLLEAMASATPVICTRVGGPPEIVQDGVTGFVVDPGKVDELRDRLEQLLCDEALARRMGRAGRAWVEGRRTWDHCALRCLSAYEELMGAE
jgi:alpha-maltose-1-phosphate synthase